MNDEVNKITKTHSENICIALDYKCFKQLHSRDMYYAHTVFNYGWHTRPKKYWKDYGEEFKDSVSNFVDVSVSLLVTNKTSSKVYEITVLQVSGSPIFPTPLRTQMTELKEMTGTNGLE
jgi:hypothetical protein